MITIELNVSNRDYDTICMDIEEDFKLVRVKKGPAVKVIYEIYATKDNVSLSESDMQKLTMIHSVDKYQHNIVNDIIEYLVDKVRFEYKVTVLFTHSGITRMGYPFIFNTGLRLKITNEDGFYITNHIRTINPRDKKLTDFLGLEYDYELTIKER